MENLACPGPGKDPGQGREDNRIGSLLSILTGDDLQIVIDPSLRRKIFKPPSSRLPVSLSPVSLSFPASRLPASRLLSFPASRLPASRLLSFPASRLPASRLLSFPASRLPASRLPFFPPFFHLFFPHPSTWFSGIDYRIFRFSWRLQFDPEMDTDCGLFLFVSIRDVISVY